MHPVPSSSIVTVFVIGAIFAIGAVFVVALGSFLASCGSSASASATSSPYLPLPPPRLLLLLLAALHCSRLLGRSGGLLALDLEYEVSRRGVLAAEDGRDVDAGQGT